VHAAPAVSCARSTKKNAHEHTGSAEATQPSLRDGVTAYFALSLVTGLFCHHHSPDAEASFSSLAPASGRQDHTTSPSARACVRRSQAPRPPHPTARSWRAQRPSHRVRRGELVALICPTG